METGTNIAYCEAWRLGYTAGVAVNRATNEEDPPSRGDVNRELVAVGLGKPDGFAGGYRFARINKCNEDM